MLGRLRRYRAGLRQLDLEPQSAEFKSANRAISRAARNDAERRGIGAMLRVIARGLAFVGFFVAPFAWYQLRGLEVPIISDVISPTTWESMKSKTELESTQVDLVRVAGVMMIALLHYIAAAIGLCAIVLLLGVEAFSSVQLPSRLHRGWIYLCATSYAILSIWPVTPQMTWSKIMTASAFAAFMFVTVVLLLLMVDGLLLSLVKRAQIAEHPDAIVAAGLLGALADVSGVDAGEQWLSLLAYGLGAKPLLPIASNALPVTGSRLDQVVFVIPTLI